MKSDSQSKAPAPTTRPAADLPSGQLTGPELGMAAFLAVASFVLYLPSLSNHFVDYDDHQYVTANKVVQQGLTPDGFVWAFTTNKFSNWLPITWLSHMLDCELHGLDAGGHHATSALLHAFNAAALFLALRAMTGRYWPAAAVAALFSVHPLRVESAAWIAERKDVLCGTFFMLALLAYAGYSRRPSAGRYLLVVLCHALGLMSKTMLVTLPCLLLLLDYWPLRRLRFGAAGGEPAAHERESPYFPPRRAGWLVLEKLPLFFLSIVSSAWTYFFQSTGGAMAGMRDLTLAQRAANAIVSVPRYLLKIVWPSDLSVFYPHPGSWPTTKVAAAAGLVLLLSVGAAAAYRRRPYLAVGWFWFLGMLVPVSGIIQVGLQSMADRYTYLPGIGLLVAGVWWVAEALRPRRHLLAPVAGATGIVVVALSVLTWRQQKTWFDTLTLFNQSIAADRDNWLALNMVGSVYSSNAEVAYEKGDRERATLLYKIAIDYFEKSLAVKPDHYPSFHNLGWSLYRLDRVDAAMDAYRTSIRLHPTWGYSHIYLGVTLAGLGRLDEAVPYFEEAVKLMPNEASGHFHFAEALLQRGRKEEAVVHLRETLRINPAHDGAKHWLELATAPTTAPAAPASQPATHASQPATQAVTRPAR